MMKRFWFSMVLLTIALPTLWAWDGSGTDADPYLVKSTADWQQLAADVSGGESYAGKVFRLTQDIDVANVMVGTDTYPFSGTFDGDNYTLTFNSGPAGTPVATACAPFYHVSGATIRHLNTAGTIYTKAKYAAGIVSQVDGSTGTQLYNCTSAVTISSSVNGDGTHGGLVGLVKDNTGKIEIDHCSFKGQLVINGGGFSTTDCGGIVGYSSSAVSITNSIFSPQNEANPGRINSGASFARMSDYSLLTLTSCYTTRNMNITQGSYLISEIHVPTGCSYEFISEPDTIIDGTKYYTNGCYVKLTVPEDQTFDHWEDNLATTRCYISNPWQRDGIHQLKSLKNTPSLTIMTTAIPEAVTERTLWGVKYRYLSRKDYFYYVSDEDLETMGWEFYDNSASANLVVKGVSDKTLVTAIVGYDESGYNSDGVQVHNDLYQTLKRDHTHLGIIAPYAFKGSTKLTSLYFKDTNGNTEGATTDFKFIISDEAFASCPNFEELKMMQHTTTGSNRWEMLKPGQVTFIGKDVFGSSVNARVSCHRQVYQDFLSSETWKDYQRRIIVYDATVEDFDVTGVRYHYYRDKTETRALTNSNKDEMLENHVQIWNADYQQFTASSLLDLNNETQAVYYTSIVGAENDYLDSHDGVMRIYNDPGTFYSYKTICLGRNAFKDNTHVKAIEFYQTNGDVENCFSDLKMVIQNGAFTGCTNLKELRMYYYVQDGDDHWETLGPENVIPGDNIFGILTDEEYNAMTEEEYLAAPTIPAGFKIIVSPARYNEFMADPNWAPYMAYIETADYEPTNWDAIERDGVVYDYASSTVNTASTNQIVTQSLSWWNVPIKIYEAVTLYQFAESVADISSAVWRALKESDLLYQPARVLRSWLKYRTDMALVNQIEKQGANYNFQALVDKGSHGLQEIIQRYNAQPLVKIGVLKKSTSTFVDWADNAVQVLKENPEARKLFVSHIVQFANDSYVGSAGNAWRLFHKAFEMTDGIRGLSYAPLMRGLGGLKEGAGNYGYFTMGHLIGNSYASYQGLNGEMSDDDFQRGLIENMKANIHNVSYDNTLVYTPEKKLIYHMYLKSAPTDKDSIAIYNDIGTAYNYRTVAIRKAAFQNHTNLKYVGFAENASSKADSYVPMQIAIPDSAFAGCTNLTRFNLTYKTRKGGYRGLGPENFILGGNDIFADCDTTKLQIVVPADRKEDFLNDDIWKQYARFFVYYDVIEEAESNYTEFGVGYTYAYDGNTTRRISKITGHTIEHLEAVRTDEKFLEKHQGAMGLFNDIGVFNNYKLDAVKKRAFAGSKALRTVSFWDLMGWAANGDSYTTLGMKFGDECFADCPNLANIDMLYCVTDGSNHIEPLHPQQVQAGKNMFEGSPGCIIKMLPQQVAWFEADTAWVKYKDRFRPCIIRPGDGQVKKALKDMVYYTPCASPSKWDDYIDIYRIAGKGWSWLDGRLTGKDIRSFSEFKYFECAGLDYIGESWFEDCKKMSNIGLPSTIKRIGKNAFNGCDALMEIELPAGVVEIGSEAFNNCDVLTKIVVRGSQPATLTGVSQFNKLDGLKIYVPDGSVDAYKQAWAEYAQYIVSDKENKVSKHVVLTEAGTLAEKLGLTVEKSYKVAIFTNVMEYLHGNYAQYDSLTVSGPLNGLDIAVLRYMAGEDAFTIDGRHTDGQLRYLNLADARLVKDTSNPYRISGNWRTQTAWKTEADDEMNRNVFRNCDMLETVILPKSLKKIRGEQFYGCTALKRLAVLGDGMAFGENYDLFVSSFNFPLLDQPLEELVFLTDNVAAAKSQDAWGQDIGQIFVRNSQLGDYLAMASLTSRTQGIYAPFSEDAVMEALAAHEQYFPDQYISLEEVEGIFNDNQKITNFDDFYRFTEVKRLNNTFSGCSKMVNITLPQSIEYIGADAFTGCVKLDTIRVLNDSVPELAAHAFTSLPADFVIYVPRGSVKVYREKWAEYADHINPEANSSAADDIIEVTLTEPNTLAEKLGLTQTVKSALGKKWVNSLTGDYSRITRLKVNGPISGGDLDVLRYLAGYCPWKNYRNYTGHLEYIDLYDAQLTHTDVCVKGYRRNAMSFMVREDAFLYDVVDNQLPPHAFLRAYSLKTLILPRTCKEVEQRAMQECEDLEILVIGDDMEDFNWNSLDDDVSLMRLYILAKKKPQISSEFAVWRWLCNNYNPTFDAFYVRPSLYEDYAYDSNYTGNSWQRTNNVTSAGFTDDETFCAFGAHAAANLDDMATVTSVDGWFDNYPGIRDLSALRYTSVNTLKAKDMQVLTHLEKVALPVTLQSIDDGAFSMSPNLRYVDGMIAGDNMTTKFSERGFKVFGIDSLKTLVYLPSTYTGKQGTNIVLNNGGTLTAKTFRLVDDKDYCVPYAFTTASVENTRQLSGKNKTFSAFLPYELTLDASVAKVYKPTRRDGSVVTFSQVADGRMEALKPYIIRLTGKKAALDADAECTIPASTGSLLTSASEWDVPGYTMRGTHQLIDNTTAAELGALVLNNGEWTAVTKDGKTSIAPFRAYMLQSGGSGARSLAMELIDDATGINTIRTVDLDGTERYYDLNGRELQGKPEHGIYIYKGKKYISK